MKNEELLHKIKLTVHSHLPDAKIFLFGSRARGEYNIHSDYDLLIITGQNYSAKEKMNWESKIGRDLVYSFHAPFDVILQSEKEISITRGSKGHIAYYALKDGIEI